MLPTCVNSDEPGEIVYFSGMAEKPPTVAVLHERLGTAIRTFAWLGSVAVLAIVGVGVYFNHKISDHGERLSRMDGQLGEITKNVNRILDRTSKNALANPGATATAVATNAGAIKDAAIWSRQRKLQAQQSDLTSLGDKLLTAGEVAPTTPDVWPALAEVINYRTEIDKQIDLATLDSGEIKYCAASPGVVQAHGVREESGNVNYTGGTPVWEDCYLKLDDPKSYPNLSAGMVCRKCIIEYSGGAIHIPAARFEDCIFVLHISSPPRDAGLRLVRSILQNPNSITLG